MIWDPTVATTRILTPGGIRTQVQQAILRRMATGYTTWRGMCLSGVGTGMEHRMGNPPQIIPREQGQDRAAVCCAAAIGTASPATRGAPIAATTTRAMPATASLGSVV